MNNSFFIGPTGNKEFIQRAAECIREKKRRIAFVSLDISNFKYINDFYGMDEGDKVITMITEYFFLNQPYCLASYNLGCDQFRALYDVTQWTKEEVVADLEKKAEQFEHIMSEKYPLVYNHVYMGIYFADENLSADNIQDVRNAIDCSHNAKKQIKGNFNVRCQVYNPANSKTLIKHMSVSNMFIKAVEQNRIQLYLQPKISASGNCVVGAEALVRIVDEDGSIVMPGSFIPVLEDTGLIGRLDSIMVKKVMEFQHQCMVDGMEVYPVSVNISRPAFVSGKFAEDVISLVKEYGVDPKMVNFEVLESTFNTVLGSMVDTIMQLREYGFTISVDDFGAGYSSLNQIANIPADEIKLDHIFAVKSLQTEKGREVVKSIIQMLNKIPYHIVFEGIETKEQLDLVTEYGCDVIQGFYYCKPIPSEEFLERYGKNNRV